MRWEYVYLFRIDSGVQEQEKCVYAGVFWCTWAHMEQRESGPGAVTCTYFSTCHPNAQHTLESSEFSRTVKIIMTTSVKLSSEMECVFQDFMKQEF